MLGLKLIHVSKRGPWYQLRFNIYFMIKSRHSLRVHIAVYELSLHLLKFTYSNVNRRVSYGRVTWPCITTAIWGCRKAVNQWLCSSHLKVRLPLAGIRATALDCVVIPTPESYWVNHFIYVLSAHSYGCWWPGWWPISIIDSTIMASVYLHILPVVYSIAWT